MFSRTFLPLAACLALSIATPASAQNGASRAEAKSIVGTWVGTATVPVGDSAITVPVSYTFTQSGKTVAGTAMVPGQGMGTISNVVQDGSKVRFRVTVAAATAAAAGATSKERLLEHDGAIAADGAIEGMVSLDSKPIARFRIAPAKGAPAR